jgi:hypothetical protein
LYASLCRREQTKTSAAGVNICRPEPTVESDQLGEPGALALPYITPGKLFEKALDAHGQQHDGIGRRGRVEATLDRCGGGSSTPAKLVK